MPRPHNNKPLKVGDKFGRWVLITDEYLSSKGKSGTKTFVTAKCICGTVKKICKSDLIRETKNSTSCGCYQKERASLASKRHGESIGNGTHLYQVWCNMKTRCLCPTTEKYHHYGGKGVEVYEKWLTFEFFRDWAKENGYLKGLSIERKDSNKDYCPENCIWIPIKDQPKNTSRVVRVDFNGEKQSLISIWESEETDVPYRVFYNRVRVSGWDIKKALKHPFRLPKVNK